MHIGHLIAYFFGGMFLTNAIPHFVAGLEGRTMQSPFAKPPGKGKSSSVSNVLWGFFNIVVGFLLVTRIGDFHLHNNAHIIAFALGSLLISLQLASNFGKLNGGNKPTPYEG